ncbi:MAG: peroxidase [Calditrichaeota bacterium]|nr:MAG: peroxidase [Calditrichota bacterium]
MHHGAGLRRVVEVSQLDKEETNQFLLALKEDFRTANITAADRAMLDYAVKLTHRPAEMTAADVQTLKKHGFDDRAIHDICAITAYFAFVNRIADGLGVELETS